MGGRSSGTFLGLAVLLGMLSVDARSEELASGSMSAEMAALHARMATLERQMQTATAPGNGAKDCGCADSASCDCGWYAGVGAYFLKPYWTSNPAFATSQGIGGVATTTQTDFDYGLSGAPLVWIGYRGPSCLGFELRGWWFHDSEAIELVNAGGGVAINSAAPLGLRNTSTTAGDELSFASSLDIDVVDLLGSYQATFGLGTLDLGAGVRYARVEQQYRHVEDPAANALLDRIESLHDFEGLGPTLALRGRAAISQRLTAIADLRYSVLYGDFDEQAVSFADNVLVANRLHSTDDFLNIAEIELGAEYVVPCDRVEFFLDGALVAQVWEGAGNSANNDSITLLVDPEVADKNADLALFGFRLGGGVRF
jgi:hypothetical protein